MATKFGLYCCTSILAGKVPASVGGANVGKLLLGKKNAVNSSLQKIASTIFFGLALCLSLPQVATAAPANGDFLNNTAFLDYQGSEGQPVAVSRVQFRSLSGGQNQPPTAVNLACQTPSGEPPCENGKIPENQSNFVFGTLTAVDADSSTHTFSVLDDIRFEIVNGELRLAEGEVFDFESGETVINITIRATDPDGLSVDQVITIEVTDVNEQPFNLTVNNSFVIPGSPERRIGLLNASDVDAQDIQTYSVIGDDRFRIIDGNILGLADGITLGPDTTIPVTVLVTDKGGLTTRAIVIVTTNPPANPGGGSPTIVFMAPDATGNPVDIPEATCAPPGGFIPTAGAQSSLRVSLGPGDVSGTRALGNADAYAIGDPIIVSVADPLANIHPFEIERIDVRLDIAATGDSEILTLVETEANSGVFFGFVFTTSQQSVTNDCILTVASRTQVDGTYTNRDGLETVTTLAQISPVGILFNDETGEPINGVILALINEETGEPAAVNGDGPIFALYPSTVVTGESIRDDSGALYENGRGEYRFPAIPEGRYRLVIFNDEGWGFSGKEDNDIQQLGGQTGLTQTSNGRYVLSDASRGLPFHVSQGSLPRIDIPVVQRRPPVPLQPSPSQIEFLQYSANPNFGTPVDVGQTTCVAGVTRKVAELRDVSVPVPGVVNLVPATVFKAGQPIFVRVTDLDQNFDPLVRERITIQLQVPASGDREFIRLLETGPDTGQFVGYIQSTENEKTVGSCMLGVVKDQMIRTIYSDLFDETDVSDAMVLVDPFGRIFSTKDGRLIDGISVTLIDTSTGLPAQVFGDGPNFANYPSTVISGGEVTDDAGVVYDFPEGEYRFPFVEPGFYQLRFEGIPGGLRFPSTTSNEEIQALTGAPFQIVDGSRGEEFEVPVGPALNIDVPLDESLGELFVSKQTSTAIAAFGDFVQYRVTVQNVFDSLVTGAQVIDVLPTGFRYQTGSLRIDGVKVADPAIAQDGRTMTIDLPAVSAAETVLSYVTEVTPAATMGEARNSATVIGDQVESSNTAFASVIVRNDLFSDKAFLIGRVYHEQCPTEAEEADDKVAVEDADTEVEPAKGVQDVRIYLEDGSFVVTDDNGFWHMEGIEPGTHIVQLDLESLDQRYEVSPCNDSTRFAGSGYSQFVDVQGGTVWRADFKIQDKPPPSSEIQLTQSLKVDKEGVWVEILAENQGEVEIRDANVIYRVPKGWKIVPGTEVLEGNATGHQRTIVGTIYKLGTVNSKKTLRFKIEPKDKQQSQTVIKGDNQLQVLRPRFKTRSAALGTSDIAELNRLLASLADKEWQQITVVGHSDNVPIAPRNRTEFKDNKALSEARAASVAEYIGERLKVENLVVVGAGDQYPVASNATSTGRQMNRRVELLLKPKPIVVEKNIVNASVLNGKSSARMMFASAGNPKGKTASTEIPLNRLVGGFDKLSASATGIALGSWDEVSALADTNVAVRDPNVQGFINLIEGERMGRAVKAVKLDLDSRLKPTLSIDGEVVSNERIGFKKEDTETGKTLYSYIGVDFGDPGAHVVKIEGVGPFGNVRFSQALNVVRVGELFDIRFVESGDNIADGRTPVKAKVALFDRVGEPLGIEYRLQLSDSKLKPNIGNQTLTELTRATTAEYIEVDDDGVIRFDPVSVSGTYEFTLSHNDFEETFEVYVAPEKRQWIMVGLAEGSAQQRNISGNIQAAEAAGLEDDIEIDGRIAFYAKGQIKGEYVLTLAYDTDKPDRDALSQAIDPNSYYTLYGDKTSTQYDASSQEKLFLKLEKDQFYALFGDYSTGVTGGELTSYSRNFSGFKSEYQGEEIQVVVFAAETDQGFVKDEIRGDGTSGLYRLTTPGVITNSEEITIEVRDRFRSQDILEEKELRRYIDYNIDYDAGTIFFKEPIFSQDTSFNPIFIVVDYEVDSRGTDELNAGGRIDYQPIEDLEIGLTLVKEGVQGRKSELVGVDVTYEIDDTTEVRAEIAASETETPTGTADGTAFIVEATKRSEKMDATIYVREQEGGFGLGQQNESESGQRKVGATVKYQIAEGIEAAGEIYRDTDLATNNSQDVAATTIRKQGDNYSVNAGLRTAMREADGEDQVSNQLLLGGSYKILDGKLVLSAQADAPIGGKGEAGDFPKKLRVGLDYKLNDNITLSAEQEFSWGDELDTQGTRLGMSTKLWEGGELVTSLSQADEENSQRLAAVAGLKQRFDLNENWSFDFGIDRSQTIKQTSKAPPELTVTTVFSSPNNDDFTSVTFGSKFRKEAWDWSTRVEYRDADSEDRINLVSDVIHNLDEGQQLLAKFGMQKSESDDSESTSADIQLGYSYRPLDSRWTIFNRLDLRHNSSESVGFDQTSQKIINNLNANYIWNEDTQIAFQYGMKYVRDNFDSDEYSGFTDLYGMEVRHDLSNKWDIGFQGSFYNSHNADISDYSYGVSFGYSMARNVWVSLGYNFDGFQDDDFSASEYTSEGVFLKYRLKFDQNTADSILGLMRND